MYDQVRVDIFFIIFYSMVTAMAMMAGGYLMFRRANAIAPDITPPLRLRRWVATFFASIALTHAWYMPILFLDDKSDIKTVDLVGGLLDSVTLFPLAIVVLLVMLQDRRRPLWPVAVMMVPIVIAGILCIATFSYDYLPMTYAYFLLMCIGIIVYMVREVRRYGRWLRDNYADLEHKEVWQSFLVLAIILLVFGNYVFTSEGTVYIYAMQVAYVILVGYLLWRVETLSDLGSQARDTEVASGGQPPSSDVDGLNLPQTIHDKIGPLLQQHCIDTRLYLQHDLTISQLAQAVGTNRYYLSQYFSRQGMTYNTYINTLRINHFVCLYRKALADQRHVTAKQLASDSGYRSYTTFSAVFKQLKGQTVTAWMRQTAQ